MILQCIISQFHHTSQVLQGSSAYCLGVLLRHVSCLDYVTISKCCDVLLDCLGCPHEEIAVVENVFGKCFDYITVSNLECVRLILKFPGALNCVITNSKFPKVLRLNLGSHKGDFQLAALSILLSLLSGEQTDDIALFLHELGILGKIFF